MQSTTDCCSKGVQRINQFALVSYLPNPLGRFLDDLRTALVPDCKPRAHVTILPPRPLCGECPDAISEIQRLAEEFRPFTVKLGAIAKFPVSDVIYVELASGKDSLKAMYDSMNSGVSAFCEPFPYHPHITVAQNLEPGKVDAFLGEARAAWNAYAGERSFAVEKLSFVQNTTDCRWIDLADIALYSKSRG